MSRRPSESGNVLFFILIAVALFAALSYAVSSQNRASNSNAGSETTLVASSDIIQYASGLENAFTYLRVSKQCAEEEISFERPPFDASDTNYINASAPADFSCHVFHPNGGRMSSRTAPRNANDGRDWAYIEAQVLGIGADQTACGAQCSEILLVLGGLNQSTCQSLNKRTNGADTIPVQDDGDTYESQKYTGSFTNGENIDGGASGLSSLCTQDSTGVHYFYHVLLPR